MERKIVAELSVVPLGTGKPGVSEYVAACIEVLENRNDILYRMTPMGTIIEGSLDAVLDLTRSLHAVPFSKGALRVITTLKIDDRCDKELSMEGKLRSIRERRPGVAT
jgi:uncharacterized protein (TIGR00106 family)